MAVAFFALAQGTAGTAPASVAQFHGVDAGVLPGNILHSVERLIERASVVLTRDPERRAEREVRIADERAAELDRVLERAAFEEGTSVRWLRRCVSLTSRNGERRRVLRARVNAPRRWIMRRRFVPSSNR